MPQTITPPFWHPARADAFVLDWDGILADTRLDFGPLRRKYFGGKRVPLLEALETLEDPLRAEVENEIRRLETEGAENARPVEGAPELIAWLNGSGKPWAVVSRNCQDSILLAAERCGITLPPVLLSREAPHVKPAPEALALAARKLRTKLASCVMVGDFIYDLLVARRAAVRAVLIRDEIVEWSNLADVVYPSVKDFVSALSNPQPLIPWEYHNLVLERGVGYLEAASRKTCRLQAGRRAFRQAMELADLGVIHFEVPEDAVLELSDWKQSSLPAQSIGMPLHALLRDVMASRRPCVQVTTVASDAPISGALPVNEDGADREAMERFLATS